MDSIKKNERRVKFLIQIFAEDFPYFGPHSKSIKLCYFWNYDGFQSVKLRRKIKNLWENEEQEKREILFVLVVNLQRRSCTFLELSNYILNEFCLSKKEVHEALPSLEIFFWMNLKFNFRECYLRLFNLLDELKKSTSQRASQIKKNFLTLNKM